MGLQYQPMVKVIIVLGTANYVDSKKRVDRAVEEFFSSAHEYFSDHDMSCEPLTYVLLTGTKSEVSEMTEYILKKINKKHLIFDSEAKSTVDNLKNSKKILKKLYPVNFGYTPSVVVCTSTYHIKRAAVISQFILSDYRDISYIHTNEEVSIDKTKVEMSFLNDFLEEKINI